MQFDYFYGSQADQFSFYRIPKVLFTDPQFKPLSTDAKGGPGLSTTFIIQYIFDKGFNQMQYGYASAISTVVMIIFALIAFAQFKVNNGGET